MTISAVLAPLRSMIALVARVVPWMIRPTAPGETPASRRIAATPPSTPRSGSAGVVSTLVVTKRSPSSSARSVKVPPISTARRPGAVSVIARLSPKATGAA